jgi:4-amino-4-deoxy-L-arabinose transferase-like glycosyltransferase
VNPEFASFFFIQEHFARFATTVHHRSGPLWYFVPVVLLGLLPWIGLFLTALVGAWTKDPLPVSFSSRRFLIVYIGVVFVFFSLSGSKLISYVLPLFPAAAMLIGWHLSRVRARTIAWHLIPILVVATSLGIYLLSGAHALRAEQTPAELYDAYGVWLHGALGLFIAGLAAAVIYALRGKASHAVTLTSVAGLLCAQLAISGFESLSPVASAHAIAVSTLPYLKPGVPIYSIHGYEQTLPFYLKHTVVLVEFKDEMDFGLQQEPQLAVDSLSEFETRWKRHPDALAFMHKATYDLLVQRQFPMQIVARDPRNIVVRKP